MPRISMTPCEISGDRIRLFLGEDPSTILDIRSSPGGRSLCTAGRQRVLVRTPSAVSEPIFLTQVQSARSGPDGLDMTLADATGRYKGALSIARCDRGIRFGMTVRAPVPVWLVEWELSGLKLEEVIVPALGGQVLTNRMPEGTTLSYKYPFWWSAQFAVGTTGKSGIWLHAEDPEPNLKLLRVSKSEDGFALTYGIEASAPLRSKTVAAEWYIDCFEGSWTMPVDVHRQWLERAYGLTPLSENRYFPAWARKINFVLEVWGMRKDRPVPHHTFEQMIDRLRVWKAVHPPAETLVYLPGFAEHGIDSNAPSYAPSPHLGGKKDFRRLVRAAHDMGYRVMAHINILAMTFTHPMFSKFKKHQVVDCFGRAQGWGLDIDGDWLAEPYFAYINPGVRAWGDLMENVLGDLIQRYNLDAVFLDQSLLAFNVSKGPNFLLGIRRLIDRLHEVFPGTLFAGEGFHEHVARVLPMAQIHGIDSIAEVHGAEGRLEWRTVHPVSTYLFGKYALFVAHLLTKHPSNPVFKAQEDAYRKLGVLPALCLYDHTQEIRGPEVDAMVERAKALQRGDVE